VRARCCWCSVAPTPAQLQGRLQCTEAKLCAVVLVWACQTSWQRKTAAAATAAGRLCGYNSQQRTWMPLMSTWGDMSVARTTSQYT
jgi:hypothetical protein